MKQIDEALVEYEARRFRLNRAEKAAYAVGFHAGIASASRREPVPHYPEGGQGYTHCGCPICCFGCDACAEDELRRASEDADAES